MGREKCNCPNCGAPIAYEPRCPYCGTKLNWIPTINVQVVQARVVPVRARMRIPMWVMHDKSLAQEVLEENKIRSRMIDLMRVELAKTMKLCKAYDLEKMDIVYTGELLVEDGRER